MDFTLIEKHPWATTAAVGFGGLALFVLLRRGGSGSTTQSMPSGGYVQTDPNAVAASNASSQQAAQLQAQLQALNIQGSTQIQLAGIGLQSTSLQVAAAKDVQNTTTSAELMLGLATQQAVTDQARINAGIQLAAIDALTRAYGGSGITASAVSTPPTQSVSYPGPVSYVPSSSAPGSTPTTTPAIPVSFQNPVSMPPTYAGGYVPTFTDIIPGGQQVLPAPTYRDCDPRDVACVAANQKTGVNYRESVDLAENHNKLLVCLANAEMNRAYPDQYNSMISACHSQWGN